MLDTTLADAVERFTHALAGATDEQLALPWTWGDYDSEGLRFASLRAYEELRALAVQLLAERVVVGPPITQAQRILGQYHAAYRDLDALLLGVSDDDLQRPPAPEEWSLAQVVRHIVEGDGGFFVLVRYALERHRSRDGRAPQIPESFWVATLGPEEQYDALINGPLAGLRAYHAALHERILGELYDIDDGELELPSSYWESYEMPLRFRLHRFDSHIRQHLVQAEKVLAAIGREPSEAKRLLRLVVAALTEAEAATIGAWKLGADRSREVAGRIAALADEIAPLLSK